MNTPLVLALFACAAQEKIVVERDDAVIDRDCVVEIGSKAIEDAAGDGVIRIAKAGITVDMAGSSLHGAPEGRAADALTGIGILIEAPGVTLRNARVSGFNVGILARKADGLVLEGCDVSGNFRQRLHSTPEAEDASDWLWPHENDGKQWRTNYGAGICVEDSWGTVVRNCRAREGQNGLILDRVDGSQVYDNDFSFLSGWGIAMWRSSANIISRNALDFCVRGYSHEVYNRGQDSAGLLMFEQCCRNRIVENSITHGGDGVFGFAGKEALGEVPAPEGFDYKRKGCNDNLFLGNDLSFSAAHGLELTFSFGNHILKNQFRGNAICGIWGGYSQETLIYLNSFINNGHAGYGLERGGVNIEHSRLNIISSNGFEGNACGIHLWWDDDQALAQTPWARANGTACEGNRLEVNSFREDALGIHLSGCSESKLFENGFAEMAERIRTDSKVEYEEGNAPGSPFPFYMVEAELDVPGASRPVGARDHLESRNTIIITDWGPYDWQSPHLQRCANRGSSHVWRWLGTEKLTKVKASGAVEVDREERGSDGPWIVVSSDRRDTVVPYEIVARGQEGVTRQQGRLWTNRWAVRVFPWTKDPREDEIGWRAEANGGVGFELSELDLSYGMGGASQLSVVSVKIVGTGQPVDRFGTLAKTQLSLPKGRWRLTVTSDDGVRVKVDDETVLEDWTWHAPKTDSVELEIEQERRVHLEVEHFELDGFAVLKLALAPVD